MRRKFKISYCTAPCKILKFHVVSIGCYAELRDMYLYKPKKANSAQKHSSRNQARLKF